jgi:hypothetical protein
VHIQKKPGGELEHHEFLAEDERDPRPEFLESLIEVLKDQPTFPSPLAGEGGPSADGPGEGFQISTPLSGGDRKLAEHSGVGVLSDSPPFQKTQPRSAAGKKSGQECQGSIVVYNRSFESGRLNDLARWLSSPSLVKEGARGRWSPALVQKYRAQIENIQARLWDLLPFIRDNIYHPNFHGSFSIKSVLPALIPDMTYEGMLIGDGKQAGLAWEKMVRGGIPIAEKKRVRDGLLAYCRQDTLAMVELLNVIRFRINR